MEILTKIPLSVAIITKNEGDTIDGCLASVSFAEEIIIVDSGSTDQTEAIAKKHGALFLHHEWEGFGRQKQYAIDRCSSDWVLILDADERLTAETAAEIAEAVGKDGKFDAFMFPRKNYFCGQWIRHGGWWPDYVTRLFRKEKGRMSARLVHEALQIDGTIARLKNPIIHNTNRNLDHTVEKINLYSSAGARELLSQSKKATAFKALLRACWAFFNGYILRRGFLDGENGLILAVCDAVNTFFKFAKLKELRDLKGGRSPF